MEWNLLIVSPKYFCKIDATARKLQTGGLLPKLAQQSFSDCQSEGYDFESLRPRVLSPCKLIYYKAL